MTVPQMVEKYTPTLVFSEGEQYLPCDLFFAGNKIINNKQTYDKLNQNKKLPKVCCYYHVNEGQKYKIYQYWYYYAHNPYSIGSIISDDHEHDFECIKIFVRKNRPEYVTCNIHRDRQIMPLKNGEIPDILVELGGHGMWVKDQELPWYWKGEKGVRRKVPPVKSCEELRLEVMKRPDLVMDKNFRLIGDDYSMPVGYLSVPLLPWARWEYYLPEDTLIDVPKMGLPISSVVVDQSSVQFMKAMELGRKKGIISVKQYATLKSSFPSLHDEKEIEDPPLQAFFGREIYANILNQVGIKSKEDLVSRDPQEIHSLIKDYIEKKELKIRLPSPKNIIQWKEELAQMTSNSK